MKILKIIFIGFCTTVVRIIGQMLIPEGSQDVLPPSIFVQNNTMPMVFSIYGLFAYSIIASLFLVIKNQMNGKAIIQGLKYGLSCCAVWTVYLLEPLPHVAFIDKFTYPLADGVALIIMGLLCGLILGNTKMQLKSKFSISFFEVFTIPTAFLIGRLLQYTIGNSYSLWKEALVETLSWCILTGIVLSVVMQWLNTFILCESRIKRALLIGGVLFGVDLFLFNFFMPLVFAADVPDLIMRTFVDIFAVVIGTLFLKSPQGSETQYTS